MLSQMTTKRRTYGSGAGSKRCWGENLAAAAARLRTSLSEKYRCDYQRKNGCRKEFLSEILKEVRSEGRCGVSNLQAAVRTLPFEGENTGKGSSLHCINWWSRWESNPRPLECHSSALPTELRPHGSKD